MMMSTSAVVPANSSAPAATPLCVDLDGTLLRTDSLIESAIELVKQRPLQALAMPLWLLRGKVHLKTRIAECTRLDTGHWPYLQPFVDWLREQASSRPIYLVSAAHHSIAEAVARHLGFFSGVMATQDLNLSAANKAAALRERFGTQGFDYAGNSADDLPVWQEAHRAILVATSGRVARAARSDARVEREFAPPASLYKKFRLWIRALRIYQWVKNLLVLLAPIAAHTILQPEVLRNSLLAFVAFGLAASSVYLINDLLDLPVDRAHPRKRFRPFAHGDLSLMHGLMLAPLLLLGSIGMALLVNLKFLLVLCSYLIVTIAYSTWLKRKVFVDVAALAFLYTIRVVAGAAAGGFFLSFWLLSVCAYGFLSLALLKRYSELLAAHSAGKNKASGRGYLVSDQPIVLAFGIGSGLVATLVMALYLDSQASLALYRHPEYLWSMVALMIVGLGRLWMIAGRGHMHDDPIVFVAKDRFCLGLIALGLCAALIAV